MDPNELKTLIKGSNEIFKAKGSGKKAVKGENSTLKFTLHQLATEEIKKGSKFTKRNCFPKRPGIGDFLAKDYKKVLGKTHKKNN